MADGVGAGRGGNRHGFWLLKVGAFCATGFGRKMSLPCRELIRDEIK